ncbi:hypothetical protein BKA80DRAFT_278985 [Phyllosticta citrichinensis]
MVWCGQYMIERKTKQETHRRSSRRDACKNKTNADPASLTYRTEIHACERTCKPFSRPAVRVRQAGRQYVRGASAAA